MTHANAPSAIGRRRRLVERRHSRPTTHAAEAGVSRACPSKWENQCDTYGEAGLRDRAGVPRSAPTRTPPDAVERIEQPRWDHRWSARRIALGLANQDVRISERSAGRWPSRPHIRLDRDTWRLSHGGRRLSREGEAVKSGDAGQGMVDADALSHGGLAGSGDARPLEFRVGLGRTDRRG